MGRRGRDGGPYAVGDDEDGGRPLTPQQQRHHDARVLLEADPRVIAAALIAETFGLDPVAVLAERDRLKRLIRLAAHNAVQNETRKAHTRAKP